MQTSQQPRTKEYETIYILRPDIDADTAEKVQARLSEVVDKGSGKLVKVEGWGRRKLAYPVGKQRRGVYVYVKYLGRGGLVQELERNLKLADAVLKFQTVLVNDHVDVGAVTVDPEEVKLGRLELPPMEEEKEDSRERMLGLIDGGPEPTRREGEEGDEYGDEEEPRSSSAPETAKTEEGES